MPHLGGGVSLKLAMYYFIGKWVRDASRRSAHSEVYLYSWTWIFNTS